MATLIDNCRGQQSDRVWFARSQLMAAPADGYYAVIRIPFKAFISEVFIKIDTAFTAAGAILTIGFEGNGDTANDKAFMSTDVTKPTVVGMKRAYPDNLLSIDGKWFTASRGVITVTTDDQGGTAGTFTIFAQFAEIF